MSDGPTAADHARIEERLAAIERHLTGDEPVADLDGSAEFASRVDEVESTLAELEAALEEVEAGLQAVRGYAGSVRAVNREVERRTDLALARSERIERRLGSENEPSADGDDRSPNGLDGGAPGPDAIAAAVPNRDRDRVTHSEDDIADSDDKGADSEDALARLREAL